MLIKSVNGLVHLGHVFHLEGGPEMLTKLKCSAIFKQNKEAFNFERLTHLCDVAAARGHETNQGSKALTEVAYQGLQAVISSLKLLADQD